LRSLGIVVTATRIREPQRRSAKKEAIKAQLTREENGGGGETHNPNRGYYYNRGEPNSDSRAGDYSQKKEKFERRIRGGGSVSGRRRDRQKARCTPQDKSTSEGGIKRGRKRSERNLPGIDRDRGDNQRSDAGKEESRTPRGEKNLKFSEKSREPRKLALAKEKKLERRERTAPTRRGPGGFQERERGGSKAEENVTSTPRGGVR